MVRKHIKLGSISGISIELDYSWFLIFFLLTWLLATNYFRMAEREQLGQNLAAPDSPGDAVDTELSDPTKSVNAARAQSTIPFTRQALLPLSAAALIPLAAAGHISSARVIRSSFGTGLTKYYLKTK